MRDKFMAFALCIVGSMTPFCGAGVGGEGAEVERLARGNAAFAVDFYHELRASEGNIFFSPLSVSSALAMTYAGARENTAKEMKKALHFTLGPAQLHSTFKSLCRELKTNAREGGHKLNIANGLCLTGGDVSGNFKTLLTDNYDAEVFSGGLERINAWVKEKTEGKIQKILEGLSDDSVCVILNAIYFKGDWESRFDKQRTFEAPFKVSRLKEVTVPMMYQQGDFRVVEREDFQAVAIPYVRKSLSMIVLLPRQVEGLGTLERQLTAKGLQRWLSQLDGSRARGYELFLPRLRMATEYDLAPACEALGMKDAFVREKADFRGMGWPKGNLWIAQIKHKACVEVNEEGTEAAGVTDTGMDGTPHYPVFRADHPFLFLVRDAATGSILFMGRVSDPTKAKG